jgi:hypothetical protein
MDEPVNVTLSPVWKQAVSDFLAAGFKDGDIVRHVWLEEHFGMEPLKDGATIKVEAMRERQFKWLQYVQAFRQELLEDHAIFLSSVYGEGYRVTPPAEQTAITMAKFEADAKQAYRNAALRLKHVRLEELSEAERRENTDAVSKLSMLRGMQRTALD